MNISTVYHDFYIKVFNPAIKSEKNGQKRKLRIMLPYMFTTITSNWWMRVFYSHWGA